MSVFRDLCFAAAIGVASHSNAETPADFLAQFATEAQQADAAFAGFSAERGQQFFTTTHGSAWSCSSCHTPNPLDAGKHAKTDKTINPLAPVANPERFTSAKKVEKWFKRNCNDVLDRLCSAQEKGDVLTWLLTLKP